MTLKVARNFLGRTILIAFDMLHARYATTKLGLVWAIAQPALMFVVFWFVTVFGLRISSQTDVPFFAYLFGGLLPWVTFSNAVSDGMASLSANRHLVNQIDFPLFIIPIAAVLSNMIVHVPLLLVVVAILEFDGVALTSAFLILPVYFLGLGLMAIALVMPLSVLSIRSPDVGQAFSVILLLLFWFTPIIWSWSDLPPDVLNYIRANPLFWVVGGYRQALLGMSGPGGPLYFAYVCGATLCMLAVGILIFNYFRKRLGDFM